MFAASNGAIPGKRNDLPGGRPFRLPNHREWVTH
jgi:hypothetical protein